MAVVASSRTSTSSIATGSSAGSGSATWIWPARTSSWRKWIRCSPGHRKRGRCETDEPVSQGSRREEIETGKQKFLELVRGVDAAVQVVIPVTPSNSMFLISLTRGPNRKFITVSEDDIIDLPNEASILSKVTKTVKDAVAAL